MKKLLIIFLLFFPVHGAWAEIVDLACRNSSGRIDIIIDLKKKTMTNAHGTHFRNVSITSNQFYGEALQSVIDKINKKVRAQGHKFQADKQTYTIYRDTGTFKRRTTWIGEVKSDIVSGHCEQITSKKKF